MLSTFVTNLLSVILTKKIVVKKIVEIVPSEDDIIVKDEPSYKWDAIDIVMIQRAIKQGGWSRVQCYYHPENFPDQIDAWSDYKKVRDIYIDMKSNGYVD